MNTPKSQLWNLLLEFFDSLNENLEHAPPPPDPDIKWGCMNHEAWVKEFREAKLVGHSPRDSWFWYPEDLRVWRPASLRERSRSRLRELRCLFGQAAHPATYRRRESYSRWRRRVVTVMVAWFYRKNGAITDRRWCATDKTTLKYQDNVRTRCGMSVTLPAGLARLPDLHHATICPDYKTTLEDTSS